MVHRIKCSHVNDSVYLSYVPITMKKHSVHLSIVQHKSPTIIFNSKRWLANLIFTPLLNLLISGRIIHVDFATETFGQWLATLNTKQTLCGRTGFNSKR